MAEKLTISTNIDSSGATSGLQKIFSYLKRLATTIQTKLNFRVNVTREETVNRQVNETVTSKSDGQEGNASNASNASSADYVESAYKIGKLYTTMEILSRALDELTTVMKQQLEIRQNESIVFGGKEPNAYDKTLIGGSILGRVLVAGAKGGGVGAVAGSVIPVIGTTAGGIGGALAAGGKEAFKIYQEQSLEDSKNAANITKSQEAARLAELQRQKAENEANKKALARENLDVTSQIEEMARNKQLKQFKAKVDDIAKNTIEGQNVPLSLAEYKTKLENSRGISEKALDKLLLEQKNLTSTSYSGKLTTEQRVERSNVIKAEIDKAVNTLKQLDIKLAYLSDVQKTTAKTIEDNAKAEEKLRRDTEKYRLQGEISELTGQREIIKDAKDKMQDESSANIDKLENNIDAYDNVRNMLTTSFSQAGGGVGPQYETVTKLITNEQAVLKRYRETVTKVLSDMDQTVKDINNTIKSKQNDIAVLG